MVLPEAFPDEYSASAEQSIQCWVVVLVFSRTGRKSENYAGAGLILEKPFEISNAFRRIGAFHFHALTADVLTGLLHGSMRTILSQRERKSTRAELL